MICTDFDILMSKTQLLSNENNLDGIALAIVRLQELYRLEPKDMTGEFHYYLPGMTGDVVLIHISCNKNL